MSYQVIQSSPAFLDPFGPIESDTPPVEKPVFYNLDSDSESEAAVKAPVPKTWFDWDLAGESLVPLLLSLGGLLLTGMLLDYFQHWRLMTQISELFIIIPILLNLKGNLEMALASRLSTAAHLGQLSQKGARLEWANLALVQLQALAGAVGAASIALCLAWAVHGDAANTWNETATIYASAMVAMMASGMATSGSMVLVIRSCHARGINPDNIATPLAASLGDLTSLIFLILSASLLNWLNTAWFTISLAVLLLAASVPFWAWMLWREGSGRLLPLLRSGWLPCLIALLMTSISGLILERSVQHYPAMALLAPVVSGLAGNLSSIGASRLSTHLHLQSGNGESGALTRRTLLILNLPIQAFFLSLIGLLRIGHLQITGTFTLSYLLTTTLHPLLLLIAAPRLVRWLWSRSLDPDTFSLPLLTALGDCTGTLFILILFICQ